MPPSPSSTTSAVPSRKLLQRPPVYSYSAPMDPPQLPASCSNIPSPANSMSPVAPPNHEGDSTKIVSSAGSNAIQISGDGVSPQYHHLRTRGHAHQHPTPTKSNTAYVSTNPHMNDVSAPITFCNCWANNNSMKGPPREWSVNAESRERRDGHAAALRCADPKCMLPSYSIAFGLYRTSLSAQIYLL